MARPISWMPRIREIHRRVAASDRSHWTVRDLQDLFNVQPRSAQQLMHLMDREQIGSSVLVTGEVLLRFIERVRECDAKDIPRLYAEIRSEKPSIVRRKLRVFKPHDKEPPELASLPEDIALERGRLEISFRSPEDLATSLLYLASVIETSEFDRRFCFPDLEPTPFSSDQELARQDMRRLTADLEDLEQAFRINSGRALVEAMRSSHT